MSCSIFVRTYVVVGSEVIPRLDIFFVDFLVCVTNVTILLSPDVGTKDPGFVRFMTTSHRTELFM